MTLDDNKEELDSSPASDLDVSVDTDLETGADSSDAQGDNSEKDTLSIVRDVVDANRTDEEAASPAEGEEQGKEPGDPTQKKDPDNEDYSDVPFSKHPRFKQLINERNALRTDATRYQNVQKFMDTQGLSAAEGAEAFVVAGLLKNDPVAAWERLKPIVQELLVAAGEVLPADLQKAVAAGEITQEKAVEFSRIRAKQQTMEHQRTTEQQKSEKQTQVNHSKKLVDTASDWEKDRRVKDPRFAEKFVPLQKELSFIQAQEGKPDTPEGVIDQLKRAYDAVQLPVKANPRPAPRNMNARAPLGGQVSGNAQPKPQSTLDIIRAERAKR